MELSHKWRPGNLHLKESDAWWCPCPKRIDFARFLRSVFLNRLVIMYLELMNVWVGVEVEPEFPSAKYKFISSPLMTFDEATDACRELGMRLVEIESWKENAFLHDWLEYLSFNGTHTSTDNAFFIGGVDDSRLIWLSGNSLNGYSNWCDSAVTSPNVNFIRTRSLEENDCWHSDTDLTFTAGAVCEKEGKYCNRFRPKICRIYLRNCHCQNARNQTIPSNCITADIILRIQHRLYFPPRELHAQL